MDRKSLSESDICAKYISPALHAAGWDEAVQIRREVTYTSGRGRLTSADVRQPTGGDRSGRREFDDKQLRELIARLCEAEVGRLGKPPTSV